MTEPLITVRGLEKSFGSNAVLQGIELDVMRGEIVGIIGPSGSGKSTLLRCLNFLEEYDRGEIRFEEKRVGYHTTAGGRRVRDVERSLNALRVQIGMVFQNFNLFPHMTVLENVIEGPVVVKRVPKGEARAEALALLERVGLSDKTTAYPSTLSGGQQQRAAIARALAMKPKVMLFDEPTSSLDPELVGEVLDVMKALARDGMTMLIATHEMAFIKEIAQAIVFIDGGKVVEKGPPAEIFGAAKNPRTIDFLKRVRVYPG
jgi:polar amino acid transport system ATP-binding protein